MVNAADLDSKPPVFEFCANARRAERAAAQKVAAEAQCETLKAEMELQQANNIITSTSDVDTGSLQQQLEEAQQVNGQWSEYAETMGTDKAALEAEVASLKEQLAAVPASCRVREAPANVLVRLGFEIAPRIPFGRLLKQNSYMHMDARQRHLLRPTASRPYIFRY